MKERDIARILEYRLSPLYISVHATPWEARKVLLNNPRVPNIVEQLTRLADGGIQFHGQMVIVPGLNDGDVLEQSLTDLWNLGRRRAVGRAGSGGPHSVFASLHRQVDGSPRPRTLLLDTVERWARGADERGHSWVYGSDELYLLAGGRCRTPSTTATSRRSRMASARWRCFASAWRAAWTISRGSTASASAS